MKSRSRFFLFMSLGLALLETVTVRAEDAKPAPTAPAGDEPGQLKPVAVSTVFVSIMLRPFYRDSATGPRLSRLLIEEVRANSLADRAGLLKGMELLAVQGTSVTGMHEIDLRKLCETPVIGDTLVLRIVDPPRGPSAVVIPREIRVPLAKAAADTPKELSNTIAPKKRRPAESQK